MVSSKSIVIYRTGQLGDTLVSLPAIRAIRNAYPNHKLILLTDRQTSKGYVSSWDVLKGTGLFSDVIFYTSRVSSLGGQLNLIKLARRIRQIRPDAVFCLRDPHWASPDRDRFFFRKACGVRNYFGMPTETNYVFGSRDSSGHLMRYPSEADFLLQIVRKAGVTISDHDSTERVLPISEKDRSRVEEFWTEKGFPKDALVVGVAPGSKMAAKQWPLERFVEVGKLLLASRPKCQLLIVGGSEDKALGQLIQEALGERVVNAAGEFSLFESTEALRRCDVYVGNDTGTMHLAAAAGTPCVVIFSSRDHPGRWDPLGTCHIVLREEPECAGCLLETCIDQDMRCLKAISVNSVVNAINKIVGQNVLSVAAQGSF